MSSTDRRCDYETWRRKICFSLSVVRAIAAADSSYRRWLRRARTSTSRGGSCLRGSATSNGAPSSGLSRSSTATHRTAQRTSMCVAARSVLRGSASESPPPAGPNDLARRRRSGTLRGSCRTMLCALAITCRCRIGLAHRGCSWRAARRRAPQEIQS